MDAAHASFAPDKTVIAIDPTDEASSGFWRVHNPEALAMAEGTAWPYCLCYLFMRQNTSPNSLQLTRHSSQVTP